MKLKGKVAIVTGATRGIGRAIALLLAKEGADIAFTYLSSNDLASSLKKEIEDLGVKVFASKTDVSNFKACGDFVTKVKKQLGSLDILVNNAGILKDKALMMMEESDFRDVIDTNLTGVFNMSRSCIVSFLREKKGDIVNISSVSGIVGIPRQTNYSASKGGIIGFTKALAKEVAAYNVRVNAVAPGFIQTDMVEGLKDEHKQQFTEMIPFKRFGTAEEVASTVLFLLSDKSKYITGQIIQVDGGLAMR